MKTFSNAQEGNVMHKGGEGVIIIFLNLIQLKKSCTCFPEEKVQN